MSKKGKSNSSRIGDQILVACVTIFTLVFTIHIVAGIRLNQQYTGHLKRAADANSLTLAEKELEIAVNYLKSRNLHTEDGRNQGRIDDHTSIVYSTPDEQISFHYDNVSSALEDVRAVIAKGEKATHLERSNVLMKLRETLVDNGEAGVKVTFPQGLDVYPYNTALLGALLFSLAVGPFAFLLGVTERKK